MTPRVLPVLGLVGLALFVSSCGHTRVIGRNGTIEIVLTEYRLEPAAVRASAGQLTIIVHNYGRLTHNLVLTRGRKTAGGTKPIWPGHEARITLTLPPGKYLMASTILGDQALGTHGMLVVR